jgi:hypothetical protein
LGANNGSYSSIPINVAAGTGPNSGVFGTLDGIRFTVVLHPKAKPRGAVDRAKDRVDFLLETLSQQNERIVIPTPAFAEFLVLAGTDAPNYIRRIRETSIFRLEPFDERAAIELADMEIAARVKGNKRGSALDAEWQKVKFDRQIIAVAKVSGALCIYSDDPHIASHGKDCNIPVLSLNDLPLPAAVQQNLDLVATNDKTTEKQPLPASGEGPESEFTTGDKPAPVDLKEAGTPGAAPAAMPDPTAKNVSAKPTTNE